MGPRAEILRWDDRQSPQDVADVRGRVWSARLTLSEEPRRIDFDDASGLGVNPDDLVAEDYTVCQDLADEARNRGEAALIVPSAALPGTSTLVVLGPRVLIPWQLEPIDVDIDLAAAVTADRAGPPLAVLPYIRWRGSSHAGLDAWRAGAPSDFLEPVPTPI